MRQRQVTVLLVVALLVVPAVALGVVRGSPELSASAPDNRVVAGESTQLEVTLSNEGNLESGAESPQNRDLEQEVTTARSVEATLNADGAPVDIRTGTQLVSQLPKGQSATLPYRVVVDEDAEPGEYDAELEVEYRYTSQIGEENGARSQQTETRTFDVTIEVEERAEFAVVDTETDLQVGSSDTVTLTMRNNGTDTARDTTVQLESLNGDLTFGESATSSRFVGAWAPGETKTIEYQVRASDDAEPQRYAFQATASFEDGDGVSRQSDALPLAITPGPETQFSVSDVAGDLRVGEERSLGGTITNEGDTVARDVVVRYTTENENVRPAERAYSVGTLEPGESAEFRHELDVSSAADDGPRQFSYVAEFRDEDGDTLTSDDLLVRERIRPEQDVFAVDIVRGDLERGGSGTVAVEVTNQGNETLSDISAKLFANSPISANDDEAYIDELGPGETTTVQFSVSASGSALTKTYPLSVDFQYDDADGDTQLSNTYRMPITVTDAEGNGSPLSIGGGSPLAIVGGGALVALVAIGGYMRFR